MFGWNDATAHLQVRPTRRRIFTLGGSNDADSHKDVPFGGFVDIAPRFGGNTPKTTIFGDRIAYALSGQTGKILKVSCYRNYSIDFNQIWHNDRDHQVAIVVGPSSAPYTVSFRYL